MAKIERPEDTNDPVVVMERFQGLRNTTHLHRFAAGDLVSAVNVNIGNDGELSRRDGYTRAVDLAGMHSLWSDGTTALFVYDDMLARLEDDFSYTTLASGLTPNLRMSYIPANNVIYHSNGVERGAYQNGVVRSWGIKNPTAPQATQIAGVLPAGTYQWAVTYQRSDGFESGASDAFSIEVSEGAGLRFTSIPVSTNPAVMYVNLYITPQNGDMFYFAGSIPNGVVIYDYTGTGMDMTRPLRTQFMQPPQSGTDLALYGGRIYSVVNERVYYTLPYNYELIDPHNFLLFPQAVRLFAPVKDGIFIATDTHTGFLRGKDAREFIYEPLTTYGAVSGTLAYHTQKGANGALEIVVYWESTRGKMRGVAGGLLTNLTEDRFIYAPGQIGASIVLERDGVTQFISVLQN